jgi:hypothetical protein
MRTLSLTAPSGASYIVTRQELIATIPAVSGQTYSIAFDCYPGVNCSSTPLGPTGVSYLVPTSGMTPYFRVTMSNQSTQDSTSVLTPMTSDSSAVLGVPPSAQAPSAAATNVSAPITFTWTKGAGSAVHYLNAQWSNLGGGGSSLYNINCFSETGTCTFPAAVGVVDGTYALPTGKTFNWQVQTLVGASDMTSLTSSFQTMESSLTAASTFDNQAHYSAATASRAFTTQ